MPFDNSDSGQDPQGSAFSLTNLPDFSFNSDSGQAPQDFGWGDLGYGGDPNNYNGSGGLNDLFLKNLGYKGANPYSNTYMQAGESGQGGAAGYTPEFQKWMQDTGTSFQTGDNGDSKTLQGYRNGSAVGTAYQRKLDPDTTFGLVASTLAAGAGGLAGAGLAAGAGYGAGTAVGGAAAGAGAGLSGGLMSQGPGLGALKSAAVGGVSGGLVGGVDPASMTGVTDPTYARAINGATGAGIKSAIGGGNIGSSVLGSLTNSGLSAAGTAGMDYLNNDGVDPYQNETNRLGNYPAPQDNLAGMFGSAPNYSTPAGQSPYPMSDMISGGSQGQFSPDTTGGTMPSGLASSGASDNPIKAHIMSLLNNSVGTPGKMDNMSSNLMDLYNRYRGNRDSRGLSDNLASMYGPDSPYAQRMGIALSRADARSGRRTQIGPRQVELQARLAEANSRNAPLLNQMYQQQTGNRNAMLGDVFRMGAGGMNGGGGLDMLRNAGSTLSNYFNPQPPSWNATANQNSDYAPGD